ncbi:cholinesterase [Sesbania bispinosa]|nr:cholinesterase [Sesbania bispinosa]
MPFSIFLPMRLPFVSAPLHNEANTLSCLHDKAKHAQCHREMVLPNFDEPKLRMVNPIMKWHLAARAIK